MSERSKEVVKSVIDNAYKRLNEERESDLEKLNKALEAIDNKNIKNIEKFEKPEEFKLSDKRKLFENAASAALSSKDNHRKKKESSTLSSSPANSTNGSHKVSDFVKQMSKKEDDKSFLINKTKKVNKNKSKIDSGKSDEADDDDDDDDVINVANEEHVIKLTKEKENKINQEKTVVIEESYVITYKKPSNNNQDRFEIDCIINEDEMKKVHGEEKFNSLVDQSITKISKEKYKDDKKKEKERIVHENQIKSSSYSPDFSQTAEKFKPVESFQYEYEEFIELPDNSSHSKLSTDYKNDNDKIKYENSAKKTTKSQLKERFEKTDDLVNDRIKNTTIDITTYLMQDEENKISETIENSKNTQEFSYQNLKDKHNSDSTNLLNNDLINHETINPTNISTDANINKLKSSILESTFDSNENIADYYKLQPKKKDFDINESNIITENDVDTGIESKLSVSPKTFSSIKAKFESKNIKDSPEVSSLLKIPSKKENIPKKLDISKLPVATSSSSTSASTPTIGKLPRSKVQIYDQENNVKNLENPSLKKPKIFNKKSNLEEDLSKIKTTNNKDSKESANIENEKSDNEIISHQPSKKSSRKRQPQTYPIEDNPPDDFLKSSASGSDHKSSTEDEDMALKQINKCNNSTQIPRLIEKTPSGFVLTDQDDDINNENNAKMPKPFFKSTNSSLAKNDHQRSRSSTEDEDNHFKLNTRKYENRNSSKESLIPKPTSEKNFKSLVNKYELKTTKPESNNISDSIESIDAKGKTTVKKLPLNIVKLFDSNKDNEKNALNTSIPTKIPTTKDQQELFKSRSIYQAKSALNDTQLNDLEKLKKVSFTEEDNNASDVKTKENITKNDKVQKLKSIFNQSSTEEDSKNFYKQDQSLNESEEKNSDEKIKFFEKKTQKTEKPISKEQSKSNGRDSSIDKAVKNLVDKYEKKPSPTNKLNTDATINDDLNNNINTDEYKASKSTPMGKLINSLIEDSKPIEKIINQDVYLKNSNQKHQDENVIKRLINRYQPITEELPQKDQIVKPSKSINSTLDSKKQDIAQATNQDNGIKKLVDKYEKKINQPEPQSFKEPSFNTIKRINNLRLDSKDRLDMLANDDEPNDEPFQKTLIANSRYSNEENSNFKTPAKSTQNIIKKYEDTSDNNKILSNDELSNNVKKLPKNLVEKYQKTEQSIELIKPIQPLIATVTSVNGNKDQQKFYKESHSSIKNSISNSKEEPNYRIYSNNSSDIKAILHLNDDNKKGLKNYLIICIKIVTNYFLIKMKKK